MRRLHQHGVADRARQRDVGVEVDVAAAVEAVRRAQRRGQLLDEERDAAGAVVERGGEPRRRRRPERPFGELRRLLAAQRAELDLVQHSLAAQVVAQPAQRVHARELVGAVGADHQQRQVLQARGECGDQLERDVIGPVQVVEQQDGGTPVRDRRQRTADRLEQGRPVVARRRVAELGQQDGELRAQRPAVVQRIRLGAQVAAERLGERAERRARGCGRAAQEGGVAVGEDGFREARLAGARLTGEQQQRAAPGTCGSERGRQPRSLRAATDQVAAGHSGRSRGPVLSNTADTSATRLAGKPPRVACSRTTSASSASCTQ
jgi:hypothetical protein